MSRVVKVFSLLIVIAAGAWCYASPLLTVQAMRKASAKGDEEAVARFVDRAALKESLKDRFHAGKKARTEAASQDNPLAAVGAALTSTVMTPVAELLTSSENIGRMLRGDYPILLNLMPSPPPADSPDTAPDTTMAYEAYDRVLVTVKKKSANEEPIKLIFRRDGLFAWKLSAINLP